MCSGRSDTPLRVPGFPIRTSTDRSLVDSSPWLFAASHVLLRLQAPRHPPLALCSLENKDARARYGILKGQRSARRRRRGSPCRERSHRNEPRRGAASPGRPESLPQNGIVRPDDPEPDSGAGQGVRKQSCRSRTVSTKWTRPNSQCSTGSQRPEWTDIDSLERR